MDGMTTTSRRTQGSILPAISSGQYYPGGPWDVNINPDRLRLLATPMQTTTSFRTGSSADSSAPSSLEEIVDGASSYSSLFSGLKREKEHPSELPEGADTGHEFDTVKQSITLSHEHVEYTCPSYPGGQWPHFLYKGPLTWTPGSSIGGYFSALPAPVDAGYWGPKAISMARPAQSQADLAVDLAELYREGFPQGISDASELAEQASAARAAGGKYLEYQFGWLPLIGSLQKTVHVLRNYRSLIEQFHRDAGKPIRRKVFFDPTISEERWESSGTLNSGVDIPPTVFNNAMVDGISGGPQTETASTVRRVWFSGAFSYVATDVNKSFLSRLQGLEEDFNYLFGLRVTPEVLWNLAPWSWLSDWKMNVGDNIANASHLGTDGLVMRYGYLMCETITDHTYVLRGPVFKDGISGPYTMRFTTVRKQRVRATPFGFGLNPSGFSLKQWSILGALGISKGPNSLW
jgi:hypothetical protein